MATLRLCSIPDCGKPARTRGWCNAHYIRWRKHGDPYVGGPPVGPNYSECTIPECGKRHFRRGWCAGHYKRWMRHGDPLAGGIARGEALRYLRETVLSYDGDDCFPWPYGKGSNGYGYLQFEGKKRSAHRLVCELVNGPPPTPEHDAAHSCGNGHKGCCAKRHLSWKTCAQNMADKLTHGTQQRGESVVTSKLTEADVREIIALRGKATQRAIAARFGVAPSHISHILTGKAWAHL